LNLVSNDESARFSLGSQESVQSLVELFFVFLDLHRPQDVSIALDFLAQEAQVSHAHAQRSSTRDGSIY